MADSSEPGEVAPEARARSASGRYHGARVGGGWRASIAVGERPEPPA